MRTVIVGTRKSKLAVTQTKWVINELKKKDPSQEYQLKYISTSGDRNQNISLSKIGGSGVFIQDIEDALQKKDIDYAVHSMKDLPAQISSEFFIGAIPEREDHRDAYIGRDDKKLTELSAGSIIGTSSARRAAQIKAKYPYFSTKWIRGAVDVRLKQLEEGKFDGIILAVAGLKRLGITDVITEYLPAEDFIPAPGQGALAIECRNDDSQMKKLLQKINDPDSETAIWTERTLVSLLDEEDKAPIGAYAHVKDGVIKLYASVSSIDGTQLLISRSNGTSIQKVAQEAVDQLIKEGAKSLIETAKQELNRE